MLLLSRWAVSWGSDGDITAREVEAGHSWPLQGTRSSREYFEGTTVRGSSVYREDPGGEQGG